jgi:hypothetical protein
MTTLTRRAMLAGFVATAGGLLIPEPRRVYSFGKPDLWPVSNSILADLEHAIRLIQRPVPPQTWVMSAAQASNWARVVPGFADTLRRNGLGDLCP